MAKRHRADGRCNTCGRIFSETSEFFPVRRRRGRVELRSTCKPCTNKQANEYKTRNAGKVREYDKRRRADPRYQQLARERSRKFKAKAEYKEIARAQYRKRVQTAEGRECYRIKVRAQRARRRSASGSHSMHDIQVAMQVQEAKCFYCLSDVSLKYTIDHLIPLARGGSDGADNIVIACPSCNFRKADRTPQEFSAGITHRRSTWGKE